MDYKQKYYELCEDIDIILTQLLCEYITEDDEDDELIEVVNEFHERIRKEISNG